MIMTIFKQTIRQIEKIASESKSDFTPLYVILSTLIRESNSKEFNDFLDSYSTKVVFNKPTREDKNEKYDKMFRTLVDELIDKSFYVEEPNLMLLSSSILFILSVIQKGTDYVIELSDRCSIFSKN